MIIIFSKHKQQVITTKRLSHTAHCQLEVDTVIRFASQALNSTSIGARALLNSFSI